VMRVRKRQEGGSVGGTWVPPTIYFAYSVARVSRTTVTRIWPG